MCECLLVYAVNHVLLSVLLVALFIMSPDVLIAEHCQQSGHNVINEPCESRHLYCLPLCVFLHAHVFCVYLFGFIMALLNVFLSLHFNIALLDNSIP